jgi:hypothetical protein
MKHGLVGRLVIDAIGSGAHYQLWTVNVVPVEGAHEARSLSGIQSTIAKDHDSQILRIQSRYNTLHTIYNM